MANVGEIKQIIGPVVDVSFAGDNVALPEIMNALVVEKSNGDKIVLECQQHLGEDSVRAIAMDATDGLTRGTTVTDLGGPISMPIGDGIKGCLLYTSPSPRDRQKSRMPSSA